MPSSESTLAANPNALPSIMRPLICLAFFLATGSGLLFAQGSKDYEGPIYNRPGSGFLPVRIDAYATKLDGLDTALGVVSCQAFTASTFAPSGLVAVKNPYHSLTLALQYKPEVKIAFTLWPLGDFLPDISEETLTGLAEGIYREDPENIRILNYDSKYRRSGGVISPLNQTVRMLAYEVTDPSNLKETAHFDYFLIYEDYLLELSVWGPPEDVAAGQRKLAFLVNDLSLVSPTDIAIIKRESARRQADRS